MRRASIVLFVVTLVAFHAVMVSTMWTRAKATPGAADFASFYYAEQVAAAGENPYDTARLDAAAQQQGTRPHVYPFFYPPPFLLTTAWTFPLALHPAYLAWFWLDELVAVLCGLVLWRWWRQLGPSVGWFAAVAVATTASIPDNHYMGQMNLLVLLIALGGLWAEERDRHALGGLLVGLAAMLKMSPALFVGWWLLRRRWRAAAWACGTAVVLDLLALPLAGPAVQADFYLRVLPSFGSGDYNNLRVWIAVFENYSLPAYYARLFPGDTGGVGLSGPAHLLSVLTALGLVVGLGALFWRASEDRWARAGQAGAVCIATLLLPVFTFEHHLVWGLPAVVVLGAALARGILPARAALAVAPAWVGWAWSFPQLFIAAQGSPAVANLLHDVKTWSLLVLFAACAYLGAHGAPERSAGAEPAA